MAMRTLVKLALVALALAPIAASGDNSPQVLVATPGMGGGAIERFTARFSRPMVPLGDPRAAPPFTVTCPVDGEGRWVDPQTFVWEFASPLPAATSCSFELREGLRSAAGVDATGQRRFIVDSGGPSARAVLPARYDGAIEEDQVFLVAANGRADSASVAANAYCAVDGIGERIAVDVLKPDVAGMILSGLGPDRYEVSNFLEAAGLPTVLPEDGAARASALASVTALKCRRPLPPGRDVALMWSAAIAGVGGRTAGTDQRFDFTVRKPFTVRFECSRVNPQAGCNPVEAANVRFTAPIPMAQARAIRIRLPDGTEIAPVIEVKGRATIADIEFKAPLPAATAATLMLPDGVRDESGRALGNAARFPLAIRFDAPPPLVKFAAPFGILEAQEGGVLPVTVRAVEPSLQGRNLSVTGQSLRIDGSDGAIAKWLRDIDDADDYDFTEVQRGSETVRINQTGAKPLLTGVRGAPLQIGLPGKGKAFEVVGIPLKAPGFYVVEISSPALGQALLGRNAPRYIAAGALVTNMAVHFKWGREGSLAWVTALDSGKPVPGADVRVTDSCTGGLLARGTSDGNGRVSLANGLPDPETYGGCTEGGAAPLMVSARKGGDFSFALTAWGEGIRPYDFDLPYGWEERSQIFHTVFDRALMRQGDTINMKHIVRAPIGAGFGTGGALSGTLKLVHRGSDTQFDLPLSIGADGIGETAWTAPAGAPQGDYDLQVENGDQTIFTSQSFRVDEYRLPTMRATVTGPKEAAVRPKSLPVDLFVGYLSGGGASNLPVELRTGFSASSAAPDGYENFSFGGDLVEEGVKPLDGDGEEMAPPAPPAQTVPVTLGGDGAARTTIEVPETIDTLTEMLVEMDYADANGEILTASRRITLHPSAVRLGIRTDGWMMKEDDLRLRFVALDTEGKPVRGQRIQVALYSREVLTARRRLIGGFYAYDNNMRTTRLSARCDATTDAQGLASCKIDPGVSGEVYAVATTTDDAGNVARATQSTWLAGEDEWWFGGDNGDRMDVVPERSDYKAGETARFQVRMPFREATALVTVEREGVLSSFVTELSGKDPVVEVKLPGSYAPDVFVSVMAVRGRVGGWTLWLADFAREWKLPFFSRDVARPTALVDLAKPAYRMGMAKVKVGWEGHRLAVTVKADRERYAARDVAMVDVGVRQPDGSPALSAEIAFVAVDEALLQLAPNESWDVIEAMMGERSVSVLTSTAQMQVVGKRHYGRKAVAAGGGGGGDLSGLNRENFEPVLLWRGRVKLDGNGRARVPVTLSDALSSFKLVAVATQGSQFFGTGMASVRTAQDLSIFAGIPPLVRGGDSFAAGFTLRNGSDRPMEVTASVALAPAIAQGRPLSVTIPAGGAVPVAWNLAVPEGITALRWEVQARSADGKAVDRVIVSQEVVPLVPLEVWAATLARVGPATTIPIAPPAGALAGRGAVDIRLTDTLAPPLEGVRAYMLGYPYTCFEQRTSRAVALGDSGAWTRLAGEIPAYQDSDGLLRYFPQENLPGSEALTAYILALTAEAGLPFPEGPRLRAIEAMKAVLDGRLRREDYGDVRLRRIAALAALARQGAATPAMLGQIGMGAGEMPTALLGDYMAALDRIPGLANAPALRAEAERVLRTRLVYEGWRLDLSDGETVPWWMMTSADESAIKALLGVLGRPGWQDEMARMMVGVALRQSRGHWDTTPANAWGTIAARKFAGLYPAGAVGGTTTLALGGQTIAKAWPLAADARAASFLLPPTGTPLRLSQAGGAGPWAMVSVAAAVPLTRPLFAGYRIEKAVSVTQRRAPNVLTRGDVLKVRITVDATAERNWVVVSDPVPAGATIIGGLGGQSALLGQSSGEGVQPSYVERGRDAWRGYFGWVPRGRFAVEYSMRLNASGRFQLPPTRVEAMYSPDIRAATPNAPVAVAAR